MNLFLLATTLKECAAINAQYPTHVLENEDFRHDAKDVVHRSSKESPSNPGCAGAFADCGKILTWRARHIDINIWTSIGSEGRQCR